MVILFANIKKRLPKLELLDSLVCHCAGIGGAFAAAAVIIGMSSG